MIKTSSIQQFLDDLAQKRSTPGGGSVAALSGAMGAGMISMVANFTINKKGYEDVQDDIQVLLGKSELLRSELTLAVRYDVDAFNKVMSTYALPKETEADKAKRSSEIQEALKEATEVPLACARLCREVIELSQTAAEYGNTNVISDAGVAALLGHAGLKGAALNVHINLGGIKDKRFVQEKSEALEELLADMDDLKDKVYMKVRSKL